MSLSEGRNRPLTDKVRVSHHKLYGLCGVIAPIFWVAMILVEHSLIPSFSWTTQQTSDLGAWILYGSHALLQNVNFVVFGILVVALAVGLRSELPRFRAIGPLVGLFGIAFLLTGVFPDQPNPWPGEVHSLFSTVGSISLIVAQFYAWMRLRRPSAGIRSGWAKYAIFSLVCFVASLALLFVDLTFGQPGSSVAGVLENAFSAPLLVWLEVMGLRLLRLPQASGSGVLV